jgi:acyl dehydratase
MTETKAELIGTGIPYEGWRIGRRLRTIARTIGDADITAFVTAAGMLEAIFTDEPYRRAHSVFSGRPVPGLMVQAMAEGLQLQYLLQRTGIAYLGGTSTVHAPCLAGDTIHVIAEATAARLTSTPGRGIVETRNLVVNQSGTTVLDYTATRMVRTAENGGPA